MKNLFSTKSGKRILNFAYCWGACVVIAGAMFKIMGTSYADTFLYVGLIVEVIIFFLAGFEEQGEEYKWDRVYPQLKDEGQSPKSDSLQNKKELTTEKVNELYATQVSDMLREMETMSRQLNALNKHYGRLLDAMDNKNNK